MDEESAWKQLAEATDVERVFWRSIYPIRLRARCGTGGFEPNADQFLTPTGLAISFQILAVVSIKSFMLRPNVANSSLVSNVDRERRPSKSACRTNLVGNGHLPKNPPSN